MIPDNGSEAPATPPERKLYPVGEVAAILGGVTPRMIWNFIKSGELRSVKLGRRRLVPADAIDEFVADLEVESSAA